MSTDVAGAGEAEAAVFETAGVDSRPATETASAPALLVANAAVHPATTPMAMPTARTSHLDIAWNSVRR